MGYRDSEGIYHEQRIAAAPEPQRFNWADWDAKRTGTGSGAAGRVGKFDTVKIEHTGGHKVNASGNKSEVAAGTLHGRVVDGLGDRDATLHMRDSATDTLHRIPKANIKRVEVTRAMPQGGKGVSLHTPTSGEIATMGIPGAGKNG